MRPLVLLLAGSAVVLYSFAAFESYREEVRAREMMAPETVEKGEPSRHPEANLRRLRNAFAAREYTDDLEPYLDRALAQAPTFYQAPFLLAAFYANRLERPRVVEASFEAAIARFPSNGRLHLTYAEWLLAPRATAPYRSYRVVSGAGERTERERALEHITRATRLEPELVRHALDILLRFRTPVSTWVDVLPDDEATHPLILAAADQTPPDPHTRRELLTSYLSRTQNVVTLKSLAFYARKWDEPEIGLRASENWHRIALESGVGSEVTQATLSLAGDCLDGGQPDMAYSAVRTSLSSLDERGLDDDRAALIVGAGHTYLARGRLAMAESLFTEAVTLFPYHANARLGLAQTYQRAGNPEGALRELRRVLELDPENEQALALRNAVSKRR